MHLRRVAVGPGGHMSVVSSSRAAPSFPVPLVISNSVPTKVAALLKRIPVSLANQWTDIVARPAADDEVTVLAIQLIDSHKYVVLESTFSGKDAHVSLSDDAFFVLAEDSGGIREHREVLLRDVERMEALVRAGHTSIARTFVREGLFSAKGLQKLLLEHGERLFKSGRMDQGVAAFLDAYPTCRPARVVGLFHDQPEMLLHYFQRVFELGESDESSALLFIWQLAAITESSGNKKLARKLLFLADGALRPEFVQFADVFVRELRTQGVADLAREVAAAVGDQVAVVSVGDRT